MPASPNRAMTKSAVALAKEALRAAERVMPPYSHKFSPKKYTQHQLFAILVVRQFLGRDYRGIIVLLKEWSDLREAIGLSTVPNYSTLCYAERRLMKKGALTASSTASSAPRRDAA
jgi:hypothetical protein